MCSLALMSFLGRNVTERCGEEKTARGSGKEKLLNRPDHVCTGQHDVNKHSELPKTLSHQFRIPSAYFVACRDEFVNFSTWWEDATRNKLQNA